MTLIEVLKSDGTVEIYSAEEWDLPSDDAPNGILVFERKKGSESDVVADVYYTCNVIRARTREIKDVS